MPSIVHEFNANLSVDFVDTHYVAFGQVYVWNRVCMFTALLVNVFLDTLDVEYEDELSDLTLVSKELSDSRIDEWPESETVILVATLTLKYAILHQIFVNN